MEDFPHEIRYMYYYADLIYYISYKKNNTTFLSFYF